MTRSPADMYNLALSSGYSLSYAVDVYFARMTYLGLWKFKPTVKSTPLAIELRARYETLSK